MALVGSFRSLPLWRFVLAPLPAAMRDSRTSAIFWACMGMMAASLLLGGGTRGGFLSDAILELLAVPALLIALPALIGSPLLGRRSDLKWVVLYCLAVVVLPLIELVPLPPWIWTRLPGRGEIVAIFELVTDDRRWMPLSVSPNATWLSVLSLLPPMTIFFAAVQLGYRERRRLLLVVVVLGVVSAFLGLLQVAQGPSSPLRFYAVTNLSEAVGFFANRNHFAALLYAVLLYAAAYAIDVAFKTGSFSQLRHLTSLATMGFTAAFISVIVLISGEAMARSRAGLGLTILALGGVVALITTDRRNASGLTPNKLLYGAILLGMILAVQFALYRILDRFAADPIDDARISFAHNTIRAARAFMPFGSGLGSFVPVYAMVEPSNETFADIYANHAHNDVLELWLETGIFGVGALLVFAVWLAVRTVRVWREVPADAGALDTSLMRAATLVLILLIVHSFFDYPLRTEAIMAIVAVSCALTIPPLRDAPTAVGLIGNAAPAEMSRRYERSSSNAASSRDHDMPAQQVADENSDGPSRSARPFGGRWGEGIDWPAQWLSPEPITPPPNSGDDDEAAE